MPKSPEQIKALKVLVAAGTAVEKEKNTFTAGKPIRNMDRGDPFEIGDTIKVPAKADWVIGEALIGKKPEPGKKDERSRAEFLIVEYTKASNNTKKLIQLYPNSLAKVVYEVDNDGKRTGNKIKTSGTATELYATGADTADGMAKLAGRTIVVSDVIPVKQVAYGVENPTAADVKLTYVYVYDLK